MKKRMITVMTALALVMGGVAVPQMEAQAATVSVSAAVSPSAEYQLFYITSDDWANTRYDLYDGSSWSMDNTISASGSSTELRLDPNVDYDIYVYQVDGNGNIIQSTERTARSTLAHEYTVSYQLYDTAGNLVKTTVEETGVVAAQDSFVFTADGTIEEDGIEYDLASEYSQIPIRYGTDTYTFQYRMYDPDNIQAYIYYVDDRGNVLDTNSLTLDYYGGDQTFEVEQHITVNGRNYTKFSGPDTITVNYFSPVLDYDIIYLEDEPAVSYPYTVKINYVSSDGQILGTQYETITEADGEYDIVELGVPDSLEISSGGVVSYYHADQTVISHDPESTVRTYDVTYSLFDQESPYYWNVRLIDSATGNLLGEQLIEVGVGETVTFTPEAQITVNDTDYILDSSMASVFERHYDDQSSRIQNIYYNEVGAVIPEVQTLNISFRSVSDNTVLFTQSVEVAAGESYTMEVPDTYETETNQYVKLAGQGETLVHNAGTAQSDYTVYYRDVNDLQNVDTVVIQEETIYYDVPVTEEEIIYVDEETEALQPVTVVTNPTTGETQTYNPAGELITPDAETDETNPDTEAIPDEETPLANQDLNAGDETASNDDSQDVSLIEDEETPLANQDLAESTAVNPGLIIGIVAAAAVLVIVYIVISKKRKENSRR